MNGRSGLLSIRGLCSCFIPFLFVGDIWLCDIVSWGWTHSEICRRLGTFNTGTNLLAELMIQNCQITERMIANGAQSKGIRWQGMTPFCFLFCLRFFCCHCLYAMVETVLSGFDIWCYFYSCSVTNPLVNLHPTETRDYTQTYFFNN